jgi:hypothetical protein
MRFHSLHRVLLTPCMVLIAIVGALAFSATSARAATGTLPAADTPIPAGLDYSNICPGDSPSSIESALGANANPAGDSAYKTSPNGHCVKLGAPGKTPSEYLQVNSGAPFTIYGIGGWKTTSSIQIWLSDAFPSYDTRHKWPLTNDIIGPDTDIHRECRTSIKGNQANPLQSYAAPVTDPQTGLKLAFPAVGYVAPDVTTQTFYNIRVSIPNPTCTAFPGGTTEIQATDVVLVVNPITQTCVQKTGGFACFSVSPQVDYPGQPFTVTANNLPNLAFNVLISDGSGNNCTTLGPLHGNTGTFAAPPFSNMPLVNQQSGIYAYQIYLSTGSTCSTAIKPQNLYVSPPAFSIPTQVTGGDTAAITGTGWLGGSVGASTPQPLQVFAFVGSQSGFDCSKATVLTQATPASDGSFSYNYKAPSVSNKTNDYVYIGAFPQGTAASTACTAATNTACQTSASGQGCPLIAAAGPLQIVPAAGPQIPLQYILPLLALLLLLLPLFFWLGRREEDEIIVTEEDVTVAREVVDATNSQRVADATFARTIRVTKERVRLRDGKVLDKEVEEYDVYRDVQGREVRRLRVPNTGTTPAPSGQPATAT